MKRFNGKRMHSALVAVLLGMALGQAAPAAGAFDELGKTLGKSATDALGRALDNVLPGPSKSPQDTSTSSPGAPQTQQAQQAQASPPIPPIQQPKSASGGFVPKRPYSSVTSKGSACVSVSPTQNMERSPDQRATNNCGEEVVLLWHSTLAVTQELCAQTRLKPGKGALIGEKSTVMAACRRGTGDSAVGSNDCACPPGMSL